MSTIGNQSLPFDPSRSSGKPRDAQRFNGDGATLAFTLNWAVDSAVDVEVYVDNIPQEPLTAYDVSGASITFTEAPPVGAYNVYVIYRNYQTGIYTSVADGSISYQKLANNIRLFTTDNFTGDNTTVAFALTTAPADANTVFVSVDGIVQRAPIHYTTSGTTITFTSAPPTSSNVHIRHLGFRTTSTVTALSANTTITQPVLASPSFTGTVQTGAAFNGTLSATALTNTQQALMTYLLPSTSDGWRGIYRSGFDWWSRNQRWGGPWGGEMIDSATGTTYRTEFATGNIEDNDNGAVGYGAATTYISAGFKIPETQSIAAIWLKLYKVGNPTGNFVLTLYANSGNSPTGAAITTFTAQSPKLHTSDSAGAWYRFVYASGTQTLTGGVQYHMAASSSAAVDASNYWRWKRTSTPNYPFGYYNQGDATPTWTTNSGFENCFLVELSATAQTLQSSGQFDGKLQFGGSGASGVLTMSRGLCSSVPLTNLLDTTEGTIYAVGTAYSVSTTILDIGYGENHDRIVLYTDASGFLNAKVYDSTGTATTVSASATNLSSGTHSIGIYWSAKNAGADRVDILVDNTTYSSATNLSISFDKLFAKLGTMWVGGGFAVAPTYSGSSIGINGFSGLPSTLGWTYNGDATEANAYGVSGGKLYQNKNGYSSTQYGAYYKSTIGLSNTNGWAFATKFRNLSSDNAAPALGPISFDITDGTKRHITQIQEYFNGTYDNGGWLVGSQFDYKTNDTVLMVQGKGSDFMQFVNRKLVNDGSGLMTGTSASNQIQWGDASSVAGTNADAIYSYVQYYTTAWSPPQFTSGSFSELAIWQGNQKVLWPLLYNGGTFISVKSYTGVNQNYIDQSAKISTYQQHDITVNPSVATSTSTVLPEMSVYLIGEEIKFTYTGSVYSLSGPTTTPVNPQFDGAVYLSTATGEAYDSSQYTDTPGGTVGAVGYTSIYKSFIGLHLVQGTGRSGGTGYFRKRRMALDVKI